MENYSLQPNESTLYKGAITLPNRKSSAEITLTNFNIVLYIAVKKNLFAKPEIEVEVYPIKNIKVYNEDPQIKQNDYDIEIFFTTGELLIRFDSKVELSKFKMAAFKLVTGKSVQVRGAEKVKGALNLINDTLGVDTVQTVKGVFEKGIIGSVLGGLGSKNKNYGAPSKTEIAKEAISLTRGFVHKNSSNKMKETAEQMQLSYDEQIEVIKKFKELLDIGVITQEEFNAKKREVLGG